MKICSKCKQEKPISSYHKRSNRPCGVRSICKDCYKQYPKHKKRKNGYTRNYDLMKSYSITKDEYDLLLSKQDNKCAICGINQDNLVGRKKYLCVDHDHKTGKIRGLLCDSCNRGIGLLKDDENVLRLAMEYLIKNNTTYTIRSMVR